MSKGERRVAIFLTVLVSVIFFPLFLFFWFGTGMTAINRFCNLKWSQWEEEDTPTKVKKEK